MSIGAYGGTSGTTGYFYNGSLAICRVYNKVLSKKKLYRTITLTVVGLDYLQ